MIKQYEFMYIKNIITDLQGFGICLKIDVSNLSNSMVKQYLLLEIAKPIEIKSVTDFCLLQIKISNMIDVVVQENLSSGDEVMKLLGDIRKYIKKAIKYIEEKNVF